MELNVTHMVNDCDEMPLLSGSVSELGNNAGQLTWNNSQRYAETHPLLAQNQIETARDYFRHMGFCDDVDAWSVSTVQAVMVQEVASAIREMESYDSIEDYLAAGERGEVSSSLFRADAGQWYFYVGC